MKFEVMDRLSNSLKVHKIIAQCVRFTNSKRWPRENIITFIWIEQGTGISNVNLEESDEICNNHRKYGSSLHISFERYSTSSDGNEWDF